MIALASATTSIPGDHTQRIGNVRFAQKATLQGVSDRTRGVFRPGQHSHNHKEDMEAATAAKIVSRVKSKALKDKFKPASAIVDEVTIHVFV